MPKRKVSREERIAALMFHLKAAEEQCPAVKLLTDAISGRSKDNVVYEARKLEQKLSRVDEPHYVLHKSGILKHLWWLIMRKKFWLIQEGDYR